MGKSHRPERKGKCKVKSVSIQWVGLAGVLGGKGRKEFPDQNNP